MRLALALVCAALAAACLRSPSYQCSNASQCASGGVTGRCESNGFCSLPDPSCGTNGYRWGDGSPMAGTCVGAGNGDGPMLTVNECLVQPALPRSASQCASDVCAKNSRCCDREWSDVCVALAEHTCQKSCGTVVATIGHGNLRVQQWDGAKLAPLWSTISFANIDTSVVAWGDVDGDHRPDLATCESQTTTLPGKLCVWTNGGACGQPFCKMKCVDIGDCEDVHWVDADHDGDLDVVGTGAYNSYLWINDNGLFGDTTSQPFGTGIVPATAWADIDGDGQLDVAVAQYEAPARLSRVTSGGGNGITLTDLWTDAATDGTARHKAMAFGDVDLDGRLDLVTTGETLCKVWKNTTPTADGWMAGATPYYSDARFDATDVKLADVDLDQDLDLVIADDGGHINVIRNDVVGAGTDTFTMTQLWISGGSYGTEVLAVGDVNGDHIPDLIVGADEPTAAGSLDLYFARGTTGSFGTASDGPSWSDPNAVHVTGVAVTGAW
jgi:hypothetical protein